MKKQLFTILSIVLHSALFLGAESVSAQTALVDCDAQQLECNVDIQFDWNHPTTRTDGSVFDATTELSTYQIEVGTDAKPFTTPEQSCGSSGPCLTTTANTLTSPVALEVSRDDVLDDGQASVGFRIRALDTGSRQSVWSTLVEAFTFPQSMINALTSAPSAVINFRFEVLE